MLKTIILLLTYESVPEVVKSLMPHKRSVPLPSLARDSTLVKVAAAAAAMQEEAGDERHDVVIVVNVNIRWLGRRQDRQ